MPVAAPKSCKTCGAVVRDGGSRCELHKVRDGTFADRRRGTRHERGYGTEWDKLRPQVLARDAGLCQVCLIDGLVTISNIVDHIIPKSEGGTDDMVNLRCICADHHRLKTSQEAQRSRNRKLIAPAYRRHGGWSKV